MRPIRSRSARSVTWWATHAESDACTAAGTGADESWPYYGRIVAVSGCDVAIIGGGVVGCAIAHELGRYRIDVTLLEKETEVGFGTSKANSGIIHGGFHSNPSTLKGRLEWAGNQMWDALCAELGFGFARVGELTVAFDDADLAALDRLEQNAAAHGVPGVERLAGDEARQLEPNLSGEVVAAVRGETTGVVNPYEVCFGLAESAVANDLELRTDEPVTGIEQAGDRWTIHTPSSRVHADVVINAAGLYADQVAAMAGVDEFTLTARRGEEYLLDKRLVGLVERVIYPCARADTKGTLVIPTYDGTIMIGPTAEIVDDRDDLETTAAGAEQVLAAARRLVPVINEADIIAEFAGSRAVLDTEDFRIGPTASPSFINVAGIQSPGLTAAPAIATLVVDILRDHGLELVPEKELRPLPRAVHFASMSTGDQQELAAAHPHFRRIVCRCEFVTEGEIRDAVERGAHSLDGIKFRARAGMGRCQGGFCTARCVEILAEELEVPLSAVTKRGGDSWLVVERGEAGRRW